MEAVSGDFFADPMPTADVLVMSHVLHDWGTDERRALVRNAFAALPAGGRLLVIDPMIDDDRRGSAGALLTSLNMLMVTPAGSEYTAAQCRSWLAEAGFAVEGNTLYPLLRRLEKQGLLTSEWNTDESRPRKFYQVSDEGRALLQALVDEWHSLHTSIENLR